MDSLTLSLFLFSRATAGAVLAGSALAVAVGMAYVGVYAGLRAPGHGACSRGTPLDGRLARFRDWMFLWKCLRRWLLAACFLGVAWWLYDAVPPGPLSLGTACAVYTLTGVALTLVLSAIAFQPSLQETLRGIRPASRSGASGSSSLPDQVEALRSYEGKPDAPLLFPLLYRSMLSRLQNLGLIKDLPPRWRDFVPDLFLAGAAMAILLAILASGGTWIRARAQELIDAEASAAVSRTKATAEEQTIQPMPTREEKKLDPRMEDAPGIPPDQYLATKSENRASPGPAESRPEGGGHTAPADGQGSPREDGDAPATPPDAASPAGSAEPTRSEAGTGSRGTGQPSAPSGKTGKAERAASGSRTPPTPGANRSGRDAVEGSDSAVSTRNPAAGQPSTPSEETGQSTPPAPGSQTASSPGEDRPRPAAGEESRPQPADAVSDAGERAAPSPEKRGDAAPTPRGDRPADASGTCPTGTLDNCPGGNRDGTGPAEASSRGTPSAKPANTSEAPSPESAVAGSPRPKAAGSDSSGCGTGSTSDKPSDDAPESAPGTGPAGSERHSPGDRPEARTPADRSPRSGSQGAGTEPGRDLLSERRQADPGQPAKYDEVLLDGHSPEFVTDTDGKAAAPTDGRLAAPAIPPHHATRDLKPSRYVEPLPVTPQRIPAEYRPIFKKLFERHE